MTIQYAYLKKSFKKGTADANFIKGEVTWSRLATGASAIKIFKYFEYVEFIDNSPNI